MCKLQPTCYVDCNCFIDTVKVIVDILYVVN